MANGIEVDPHELARAADLTETLAGDVRRVFTNLKSKIDGYEGGGDNQPWGADKMGKKFSQGDNNNGYHASRDNLLAGLEGTAHTLDEFATGQRDAVKVLTEADQGGF